MTIFSPQVLYCPPNFKAQRTITYIIRRKLYFNSWWETDQNSSHYHTLPISESWLLEKMGLFHSSAPFIWSLRNGSFYILILERKHSKIVFFSADRLHGTQLKFFLNTQQFFLRDQWIPCAGSRANSETVAIGKADKLLFIYWILEKTANLASAGKSSCAVQHGGHWATGQLHVVIL